MALQNEKNSRYLLRDWKPENPAFWENKGKHIARRNLWISVSCLLLAFCVWMLFSAVTVNLNKIGFNFTTDQLFLLTALPSVSGALLRVPLLLYGAYIRWTPMDGVQHRYPDYSLRLAGIAVQDTATPLASSSLSLCCAVLQVRTLHPVWAISAFFFPKAKQGARLGLMADWKLGRKRDAAGCAAGHFCICIFAFLASMAYRSRRFDDVAGECRMDLGAITGDCHDRGVVLYERYRQFKAPQAEQLPVQTPASLAMSLLYLATFGSFIGFPRVLPCCQKPVPGCEDSAIRVLRPVYWCAGAFAWVVLFPTVSAACVSRWSTFFDGDFQRLLFLTLPTDGRAEFHRLLRGVYGAVPDRRSGKWFHFPDDRRDLPPDDHGSREDAKAVVMSASDAQAVTETAAALGFISAIGAIGGFFIPKAFGMSLASDRLAGRRDESIFVFYIACVVITWAVYGRAKK